MQLLLSTLQFNPENVFANLNQAAVLSSRIHSSKFLRRQVYENCFPPLKFMKQNYFRVRQPLSTVISSYLVFTFSNTFRSSLFLFGNMYMTSDGLAFNSFDLWPYFWRKLVNFGVLGYAGSCAAIYPWRNPLQHGFRLVQSWHIPTARLSFIGS